MSQTQKRKKSIGMWISLYSLDKLYSYAAKKKLTYIDVAIFLKIASYDWGSEQAMCLKNATILAQELNLNVKTVNQAIQRLKSLGLITIIYRMQKGRNRFTTDSLEYYRSCVGTQKFAPLKCGYKVPKNFVRVFSLRKLQTPKNTEKNM